MSLLGSVPCQRAYYYCGRCGHGLAPWDRAVGLTARSFTPGSERLVCLAGTLSDGFEEAATKVLPEMAGLKVAETTVQRTTEAAGRRVADHLRAGGAFAFPHAWDWHKDALGRTCAYVGIDLTGVRQQAKDGGKAEGRMPYVAMIFNPKLKDGKPQLRSQLIISQGNKVLFREPEQPVESSGGGPVTKMGQLGLSGVAPGRYVLTLVITDSLADKKASTLARSIDFTVAN